MTVGTRRMPRLNYVRVDKVKVGLYLKVMLKSLVIGWVRDLFECRVRFGWEVRCEA